MLWNRVKQIIFADPTLFELVSAVLLAVWATVLALPPPTFPTNPSYERMAALMPESMWALVAGSFSLVAMTGLIRNCPKFRRIGTLGGVFFWGSVGGCVLLASPHGTGGIVYLTLANICAFVHVVHKGR